MYNNILPSLIGWGIFGLVLLGVWTLVSRKMPRLKEHAPKISPLNAILSLILTVTAVMLLNAIWYDITRSVTGESLIRYYNIGIKPLLAHAAFALPLFVVALFLYQWAKTKGAKIQALVIPYSIASTILLIRLLGETGGYVINRFERLGIYIVLVFTLAIVSVLGFYVQSKWEMRQSSKEKLT